MRFYPPIWVILGYFWKTANIGISIFTLDDANAWLSSLELFLNKGHGVEKPHADKENLLKQVEAQPLSSRSGRSANGLTLAAAGFSAGCLIQEQFFPRLPPPRTTQRSVDHV